MKTGTLLAAPKQNLVLMHEMDFKTSEIVMGDCTWKEGIKRILRDVLSALHEQKFFLSHI